MTGFTCDILPARIRFGWDMDGAVAEEADRLGLSRLMVLATSFQETDATALAATLGTRAAGVFAGAAMHTPVAVTEAAMIRLADVGADGLVSFGGGSTTGLGKALALRIGLPQIAVPTTYAGSEVTPILGQTEDEVKTTLRDPAVLPQVVIYDVARTMTLPLGMTVTSGLNALAHAVEALYAEDANPIATMMAVAGIDAMVPALRALVADPADRAAREKALFGAWMCGAVLGQVGMALHHKLCHTLGGAFDLPHAETHSVVLPHATAYNAAAAGDHLAPLVPHVGEDVGAGLQAFGRALGAPVALRDLGMPEEGIAHAADLATRKPYPNPRPLDRAGIEALIRAAWEGAPPGSR